jgi:ComF family protein
MRYPVKTIRGADLLYQGFWKALDWFYPPACVGCGFPGLWICDRCLGRIRWTEAQVCSKCGKPSDVSVCADCALHPPPYEALFSLTHYEDLIRECVHALKYENNQGLGAFFTPFFCTQLRILEWIPDLVLPVPLSPDRMRARGYNQSALLAKPVALRKGWPYAPHGLARSRNTRSQVELSAEERLVNVAGAFVAEGAVVSGKRVLLMDDVTTTGATLCECSLALKRAGASAVYCLTLARPLHQD